MRIVNKAGEENNFVMEEGDVLEIERGLKHQFKGIADTTQIMEFSTQHFDSDSIRTEKGD